MVAIAKGTLVRFRHQVTRCVRDMDFSQTSRHHTVPIGTVGICLGEAVYRAKGEDYSELRPVIFTSTGFRVCERPETLEILCQL